MLQRLKLLPRQQERLLLQLEQRQVLLRELQLKVQTSQELEQQELQQLLGHLLRLAVQTVPVLGLQPRPEFQPFLLEIVIHLITEPKLMLISHYHLQLEQLLVQQELRQPHHQELFDLRHQFEQLLQLVELHHPQHQFQYYPNHQDLNLWPILIKMPDPVHLSLNFQ